MLLENLKDLLGIANQKVATAALRHDFTDFTLSLDTHRHAAGDLWPRISLTTLDLAYSFA